LYTPSARQPEKSKHSTPALAPFHPIQIFGFSREHGIVSADLDSLGGHPHHPYHRT